ncbi:DUF2849 domain-containing protein [Paracoccus sp. P2]|uniref:DUF2849 domain-containing protein n=1 Tax=Paracoccus pantotrophus TaxID=82367 RepID=A0A1I5F1C0_PARPN|nr:DUF2849 domain-containing protein [Paracoccus pantotrophus]MDF3853340.1 DUF2849 domain-containing protein [Paracoccus pantotrophus]QFG37056.1 DUF2849 domain-containing protein [Paracoccus pantotrophus]QLH14626.1 DUF2849 domain-containing protein [Paracoccus pantotrophus]RDD98498.1 DUF2849 domain-containing protein [Paracoccus pantotrophus]RKS52527.1 uncharacterized protein DUF2849 [Paracoccus pantotrophus]
MSKGFTPSPATPGVITANDLRMGHCVWMRDGKWTADPREAELFEDEAIAELALLDATSQAHLVVGPYLVEAKRGADGRPEPAHFREAFRRSGPTHKHFQQAEFEASNV